FQLTRVKYLSNHFIGRVHKKLSDSRLRCIQPGYVLSNCRERLSMTIFNNQKAGEVFLLIGSAFYRQEVDDLDEEFGLSFARLLDYIYQLFQARNESIMANTQQRTTGNITYPGRLNNQNSRSSLGEASIPIKVFLRDETVFSRAPGDHRRNPGAAGCL